jgi:hypothetical protein
MRSFEGSRLWKTRWVMGGVGGIILTLPSPQNTTLKTQLAGHKLSQGAFKDKLNEMVTALEQRDLVLDGDIDALNNRLNRHRKALTDADTKVCPGCLDSLWGISTTFA